MMQSAPEFHNLIDVFSQQEAHGLHRSSEQQFLYLIQNL